MYSEKGNLFLWRISTHQCFGSGFWSFSSILAEYRSGSWSRTGSGTWGFMTKNWKKLQMKKCNIFLIKNCNLLIPWPPQRTSKLQEKPSALKREHQCSGSMTFWCGSGSGYSDPCPWLMDPDPAIFVIDLQDANKKQTFYFIFSAYYFLKIHLHLFSKKKSKKKV